MSDEYRAQRLRDILLKDWDPLGRDIEEKWELTPDPAASQAAKKIFEVFRENR